MLTIKGIDSNCDIKSVRDNALRGVHYKVSARKPEQSDALSLAYEHLKGHCHAYTTVTCNRNKNKDNNNDQTHQKIIIKIIYAYVFF